MHHSTKNGRKRISKEKEGVACLSQVNSFDVSKVGKRVIFKN